MVYVFSKFAKANTLLKPAVIVALIAGLTLGGCGGDSADPLPTLSQVKTEDAGTVVTTTGFVSVEPGILEDTTGEVGFALQDTSGGLYITVDPALGLDLSNVKPGRSIQITGAMGDLNGWVVLVLENQEDLLVSSSGGFLFFPQPNTLEEINNTAATPEKEATIVSTEGAVLAVTPIDDGAANPLGWEVSLEDSSGAGVSFLNLSAQHTVDNWPFLAAGADVSMTGVLLKDGASYEIAPRGPYDISISIEDARSVADGETVLIKGTVGMVPGALSGVGEYGFSLHSGNGNGILVSISDPAGLYTDYDGDNQLEFSNGNTLPFDLGTFHDLADPFPAYANSLIPIALHVEGVMATTALGDRYLEADSQKVRRVAENLTYPISIPLPTGGVSISDVGRWINLSGDLATPPGGAPYPGGALAWRVYADGYRTLIDDGSGGSVSVLIPFGILRDSNNDSVLNFEDLVQYIDNIPYQRPIAVDVGSSLTVYGFLRDNNGTLELVVAGEGFLETSPGVANYFIY